MFIVHDSQHAVHGFSQFSALEIQNFKHTIHLKADLQVG